MALKIPLNRAKSMARLFLRVLIAGLSEQRELLEHLGQPVGRNDLGVMAHR